MRSTAVFIVNLLGLPFLFCAQSSFYNPQTVQTIEVNFVQSNWDYLLDTSRTGKDGFVMAQWVKLNGIRYDSVGVKYKGSSSYDSSFAKNPLHIELNTYKDQDHEGFTDVKLNNAYADPSMLREVLAYEIARQYMDAPQANFAKLYINGNYKGLYTNAESINKSFMAKHFYSNSGVFVKCNPNLTPSPAVKSGLKYLNTTDTSGYYNYYEMKSDYGWNQLRALCDSLSNKPANCAGILNMDRALWMLAFNNALVNLDSYSGAFAQNYYLYKDATGLFNPVLWDLNMSFAGFPFLGNTNTSLAGLSITNAQNLPVNIHANDPYWPLIAAVFAHSSYKNMYLAHLKTIINQQFASGLYLTRYNAFKNLVDALVQTDNGKFFSYTQFQNALNTDYAVGSYSVPGIQNLMNARVNYLQNTAEFTVTAPAITALNTSADFQSSNSVAVTASISNASQAWLNYRFSKTQAFTKTPLYDDGAHGDAQAGDKIYGTSFVLQANQAQYYIYAENNNAGTFLPEKAAHEFYSINRYNNPSTGQVVINEFLADNKSDVRNEFHLHEDWIELYNTSSNTLSLNGYYLSDDNAYSSKYALPASCTMAPKSFLTIWADNIITAGNTLHCNFKLNNSKGLINLGDGAYTVLDSYSYTSQEADLSQARCPDGDGGFTTLKYPTFGASNCVVGLEENTAETGFIIFPNPAQNMVTVKSTDQNSQNLKVSNLYGQTVYTSNFNGELKLDTRGWNPGIYLVSCNNQSLKLIINR